MATSSRFSRERWRVWVQECDVHRLLVSFWLGMAFVGMGAILVVIGPTLLDLASSLSVDIATLSSMLLIRAVGMVIGTIGIGVLLDRVGGWTYTIITLVLASVIATTVALPLAVHVAMFGVFMFLSGLATGSLDNGAHVVLLKKWGEKVGPCMQMLHFMFAVGAFFAPLIAKPFISVESIDDVAANSSSCPDDALSQNSSLLSSGMVNLTCLNLTAPWNDSLADCYSQDVTPGGADSSSAGRFGWAYWISCSFVVLPLVAFAYYSIRIEIFNCLKRKRGRDTDSLPQGSAQHSSQPNPRLIRRWVFKGPMMGLLFVFMFVYVGAEVAYGTFVFTFAVKGTLCFSKHSAAILTSVFWGTFAFTRFISISLALLKMPASVMMAINLTGSLFASTILLIFRHNATGVWVGSALLGTSFAGIYPTGMSWLGENVEISGKSTAVLVSGGNLGDIILPTVVGILIGHTTPDSLIFFTFVFVVTAALVITLLFVLAWFGRRREEANSGLSSYERANTDDEQELIASEEKDEEEKADEEEESIAMTSLSSSNGMDTSISDIVPLASLNQESEC